MNVPVVWGIGDRLYWLGISLLCQHNFEHNRVAKVLNIVIINKISKNAHFAQYCEIWVNVAIIKILSNTYQPKLQIATRKRS